jgi:hypothetical protein
MSANPIARIGRRISDLIADRARAGHLPRALQGDLSTAAVVPLDFNHASRALGVVVGVAADEHGDVCAAYPEWDLLFASRRVDPDRLVSDCIRLGATAIVGPEIRRRYLMALRSAGINSLSLSPAPLPRLKSSSGVARGYTLEPQSSWMTARRVSDLDVLFTFRDEILSPRIRGEASQIALQLQVRSEPHSLLVIDPVDGPWRFSETDWAEIRKGSAGQALSPLTVAPQHYWDDETLDLFEAALKQSYAIVSNSHPLAVAASLMGFHPTNSSRGFRTGTVLSFAKRDGGVAGLGGAQAAPADPHPDTVDRVAISVLIAGRYVHDGALVDPLRFLTGRSDP